MITESMIHAEVMKLLSVIEEIPPMAAFFKAAAQSNPHSVAGYENADQQQQVQDYTRDTLLKLSQIRADAILDEMENCITIAKAASVRVSLLLQSRADIYADDNIERCVKDIEVHQNQTILYLDRAKNFFPSASSSMVAPRPQQIDRIEQELGRVLQSYQQNAETINRMATFKEGQGRPGIDNARTAYGQISFDLGCLHRTAIQKSLLRIRNILEHVDLINEGLIPLEMGVAQEWSTRKLTLLQEGLEGLDLFTSHIEASKGYFTQTLNFSNEAPKN